MINYLNKTNPNLVVILHYLSKTLWVILSALFGYIGFQLYSLGIGTPGNAELVLLGLEITLENAGPGLVVMAISLACSLVGASRARVEMTEDSLSITSPRDHKTEAELPRNLGVLEHSWGLTEVARVRVPVASWASDHEQAAIQNIQWHLPEAWPDRLSEVARNSLGFRRFLQAIQSKDFDQLGFTLDEEVCKRLSGADFSLPWCARLRWGAKKSRTVDLFVCATGSAGNVKWYTFGK